MSDSDRWRRLGDLFAQALEQPEDQRAAFVHRVCGGDAAIEAELNSLVAAHDRASSGGFLDKPAAALDPSLLDDDFPSPLVGKRLGPYQIQDQIGRGGMGIVFYAEDTRLGRGVALKAIAPELSRDPRMRERLRREARAAAALSHPAIATVYAFEELEGELYLATEYVSGRTLREELAGRAFAPSEALEAARTIAAALAAAHAHGIVHRDLKPENIIRREDGQLKILDFGLALELRAHAAGSASRLTVGAQPPGTPGYMAPEQLRGEPGDMRVDVFAFGVLVYELATGKHPLEVEARSRISPPGLDAVVRRCLKPAPGDRFASGVELLAALTAADSAEGEPREVPAGLWWWQFHQLAVAAFHAALLAALWPARGVFPPEWGIGVFYIALALQTAAVTMRLHLWFTSRHQHELLAAERRRVRHPLLWLDVGFLILLLVTGVTAARVDAPMAPLFVVAAIASGLTRLMIEPATTRAAFADQKGDSHSFHA